MPSPENHAEIYTVAFAGFSEFERTAMASFFRLTVARSPAYEQLHSPALSDFLVADADHATAVQSVRSAQRLRDTVFIGTRAPLGAAAWLPRPIDPMQIVRELDSLIETRRGPQQTDFGFPADLDDESTGGMSLHLPEVDTSFYSTQAAPLSPPELGPSPSRSSAPARAAAPVSPTEPMPTPEAPSVAAPNQAAAPRGGAAREVLVVEDSGIARKFLARRLQLLGYRVHMAASGEEALSLLAVRSFAVVFLDVVLGAPGAVDGLQVCQYLRKKAGAAADRCAVVMVTGLSGPTDRVRGTLAGCDAYLTKPLIESELVDTLRHVDPGFDWRRNTPASV